MKKTVQTALILVLSLSTPYFSVNGLKADNPNPQSTMGINGSGTVISLDHGSKSGFIIEDGTGNVVKFHYAGLEVLEVNTEYVYIVQITVSGKIIIRDIHRR